MSKAACSDSFGGIPSTWHIVSLSECCPQLKSITITLWVVEEDIRETDDSLVEWRHALRLLITAPSTITHIRVGLKEVSSLGHMRIDECTIKSIDWPKWDEVIEKFPRLEHLEFAMLENQRRYRPAEPRWTKLFQTKALLGSFGTELERYLREHLPLANERGILRVRP